MIEQIILSLLELDNPLLIISTTVLLILYFISKILEINQNATEEEDRETYIQLVDKHDEDEFQRWRTIKNKYLSDIRNKTPTHPSIQTDRKNLALMEQELEKVTSEFTQIIIKEKKEKEKS